MDVQIASACNYDSNAVIDDGTCISEKWFVPQVPGSGAPVQACAAPEGYNLVDQTLFFVTVGTNPDCNSNWSSSCESIYTNAFGCDALLWIPDLPGTGRAKFSCSPVENYHLAEPECEFQIVNSDISCFKSSWTPECQSNYENCLGCDNEHLYIPLTTESGPAVISCERPENYMLLYLECLKNPDLLNVDADLLSSDWNQHFAEAYNNCLHQPKIPGCTYT